MNKTQIINYIAVKLQSLIANPDSNQVVVLELANILRDVTRDDDYSYSQNSYSNPTSNTINSGLAYTTGPSLSNSLVGEVERSDRSSSR